MTFWSITRFYVSLGSPIVSRHCEPEIHVVSGTSHLGLKVLRGTIWVHGLHSCATYIRPNMPNHTIIKKRPPLTSIQTWPGASVNKSLFESALDASKKPVLWESRGSGTDRGPASHPKSSWRCTPPIAFRDAVGPLGQFAGIIDPVSAASWLKSEGSLTYSIFVDSTLSTDIASTWFCYIADSTPLSSTSIIPHVSLQALKCCQMCVENVAAVKLHHLGPEHLIPSRRLTGHVWSILVPLHIWWL